MKDDWTDSQCQDEKDLQGSKETMGNKPVVRVNKSFTARRYSMKVRRTVQRIQVAFDQEKKAPQYCQKRRYFL